MKIVLLTNASYALPLMNFYAKTGVIQTVVSLGKPGKITEQIQQFANYTGLPFRLFDQKELLTGVKDLLIELQPDAVFVFGCQYKIPAELFSIPKMGFFNIHFSLLPAYRGRNPVFWQLKNGETSGGITIHQMTEDYDSGAILVQKQVSIFQGENISLLGSRLSMETVPLIDEAISKLENPTNDMFAEQAKNGVSNAPETSFDDLKIDWAKQSARQIENLVNAANPDYGGAVTIFRGQLFRILEVNPAEVNNNEPFFPGTIVHSDTNYGVFVACKDKQFLRINVVQSGEGFLSGLKLASLGVRAGEQFESAAGLAGVVARL